MSESGKLKLEQIIQIKRIEEKINMSLQIIDLELAKNSGLKSMLSDTLVEALMGFNQLIGALQCSQANLHQSSSVVSLEIQQDGPVHRAQATLNESQGRAAREGLKSPPALFVHE